MDHTTALRVAHDVSLAAWFGGAWMGAVGLNGATIEVDDHRQRIRVANAGWFGWAPVAGTSLAVNLATSLALGCLPGVSPKGSRPTRLQRARAVAMSAAITTTLATGVMGRRIVQAGDVPVASAVRPIADTPDEVARAQNTLRVAQWLVPVSTGLLWIINALQRRSVAET